MANGDIEGFSQVLGPVVSRDTHVLETMISGIGGTNSDSGQRDSTQDPSKPVYRSNQISRRPSPPLHRTSQELGMELFRSVHPHFQQLVSFYFDELHPCLPLLDEQSMSVRLSQPSRIKTLFVSSFIAYASFYWDLCSDLPTGAKPDQDFAWNASIASMNESSQRGDMFAIISAVLCIAGRPSKGVVHNTSNVARITAFSHSLGLNHDCHGWNLSPSEKNIRTKLWWAVVIHDRWFNFAQGTPPYINKEYYDVPLPTLQLLGVNSQASEKHLRAAECYICLCQLTEIVGDVLPLIYHVRSGNDGLPSRKLTEAEDALSLWVGASPTWVTSDHCESRPPTPGLVNIQLSYLAVRMLLKRLAWHEDIEPDPASDSPWLVECLTAAEQVVRFVHSLRPQELAGFWLPYNVHHFISAVTLLLRCALQTRRQDLESRSTSAARQLVECLTYYHETHHWDMAETALPQTQPILKKVEVALTTKRQDTIRKASGPGIDDDSGSNPLSSVTLLDLNGERDLRSGDAVASAFLSQGTLEDLFPEIFAEFTNGAFWDQSFDTAVD